MIKNKISKVIFSMVMIIDLTLITVNLVNIENLTINIGVATTTDKATY